MLLKYYSKYGYPLVVDQVPSLAYSKENLAQPEIQKKIVGLNTNRLYTQISYYLKIHIYLPWSPQKVRLIHH